MIRDWRELPFRESWVVDTEYYPGPGKANGGGDGDAITPLCLVAYEMRSGRTVRLWQDELGPFPPYRLDGDALVMGYMISAEYEFHIACGWGEPACALDPYVEFRHFVNDGSIKPGDRDKGFFGIGGALRYFCEDEIDAARKKDMRDRILQGPPFTQQERQDILAYCEDDVSALARLVPHIVPTIRSLPHAMFRAKFMWTVAQQERRGVPLDLPLLSRIRNRWDDMCADLVSEMDRPFGVYEFEDGKPHWRKERFAALVRRNGMSWPTYADGRSTNGTRPSVKWKASTRASVRCTSCATRYRSCGSTISKSGAMAATAHCWVPTEARLHAISRATRSTSSAQLNGFGF